MMLPVGHGQFVNAERVLAICLPQSSPMLRLVRAAKAERRVVDATSGRRTRAVLIMDTGHVVLSAVSPAVLAARLSREEGRPE